jgi:hypothetical protein
LELKTAYLKLAQSFLSKENERIIVELGNYNIRDILEIMGEIFGSNYFPLFEFFLAIENKEEVGIFRKYTKRINHVIKAIGTKNSGTFSHFNSRIPNLFYMPGNNEPQNYLIKYLLLMFFENKHYVLEKDLLKIFSNLLFEVKLTKNGLKELEAKGCIKSLSHDVYDLDKIIIVKTKGLVIIKEIIKYMHYWFLIKPDIELPGWAFYSTKFDSKELFSKWVDYADDHEFFIKELTLLYEFMIEQRNILLQSILIGLKKNGIDKSIVKANMFLFNSEKLSDVLSNWIKYYNTKKYSKIIDNPVKTLSNYKNISKLNHDYDSVLNSVETLLSDIQPNLIGHDTSLLDMHPNYHLLVDLKETIEDILRFAETKDFPDKQKLLDAYPRININQSANKSTFSSVNNWLSLANNILGSVDKLGINIVSIQDKIAQYVANL